MQKELKLLKLRAIWNWHATLSELTIINNSGAPPYILDRQELRSAAVFFSVEYR
jgi:hypothetical protein